MGTKRLHTTKASKKVSLGARAKTSEQIQELAAGYKSTLFTLLPMALAVESQARGFYQLANRHVSENTDVDQLHALWNEAEKLEAGVQSLLRHLRGFGAKRFKIDILEASRAARAAAERVRTAVEKAFAKH